MIGIRLLIYAVLVALGALLLGDTNLGEPLTRDQRAMVDEAVKHLDRKQLRKDAHLAMLIGESDGFKVSRFFSSLMNLGEARGMRFSYYAYTPIFSRSKIFLGKSFWESEMIGRSSVIVHELAHITHHRNRVLRGIPRHLDEAQAYRRQYLTHRVVGLTPYGADGTVFWDMMIGVRTYVVPVYPEFADRADIRWAMRQLD